MSRIFGNNGTISGNGVFTQIIRPPQPTILATDFIFSVPTTTTYQYGIAYTLSGPQLSASGQLKLGGTFSFTYSVSGSPSIDDISVNSDTNGKCIMTIDKIGTSLSDTSATVFIYATLQGSSNYDLPSTIPILQSNGIQIVKKPIQQSDVVSPNFTFTIADVSYTGGSFTVSGATSALPGNDFSYNYLRVSGPITVSTTTDGLCKIQELSANNSVGNANVVAKINSSFRYDINDFNTGNWLNYTFTIDKGNSSLIPLSAVSWKHDSSNGYTYNRSDPISTPIVSVSGASDMTFTYTSLDTPSVIVIGENGNDQNKVTVWYTKPKIGVDISATLASSSNYDTLSNPLSFSLNSFGKTFTIIKANLISFTLPDLIIQPSFDSTYSYDFTDASINYNGDPKASAPITYSSDTPLVATIDTSNISIATIQGPGNASIVASYFGNDYYFSSSIYKTLTVPESPITYSSYIVNGVAGTLHSSFNTSTSINGNKIWIDPSNGSRWINLVFTATGSVTLTKTPYGKSVYLLAVGGGGAGGPDYGGGGGGGAGGFVQTPIFPYEGETINVAIGSGGSYGTYKDTSYNNEGRDSFIYNNTNGKGGDTTFSTTTSGINIKAYGGGGGAHRGNYIGNYYNIYDCSGGSGGGQARDKFGYAGSAWITPSLERYVGKYNTIDTYISGNTQGYGGGASRDSTGSSIRNEPANILDGSIGSGGGGGAGGKGGDGSGNGTETNEIEGGGGIGRQYTLSGIRKDYYWAGGGGGGGWSGKYGGLGGGGQGYTRRGIGNDYSTGTAPYLGSALNLGSLSDASGTGNGGANTGGGGGGAYNGQYGPRISVNPTTNEPIVPTVFGVPGGGGNGGSGIVIISIQQ